MRYPSMRFHLPRQLPELTPIWRTPSPKWQRSWRNLRLSEPNSRLTPVPRAGRPVPGDDVARRRRAQRPWQLRGRRSKSSAWREAPETKPLRNRAHRLSKMLRSLLRPARGKIALARNRPSGRPPPRRLAPIQSLGCERARLQEPTSWEPMPPAPTDALLPGPAQIPSPAAVAAHRPDLVQARWQALPAPPSGRQAPGRLDASFPKSAPVRRVRRSRWWGESVHPALPPAQGSYRRPVATVLLPEPSRPATPRPQQSWVASVALVKPGVAQRPGDGRGGRESALR